MANDVYQLQIIGQCAGEFAECVLHFVSSDINSPTPGPDATNLMSGFQTGVQTAWLNALPDDYELGGYKCKRVNNTGGPEAILNAGGAAGTFGTPSAVSGMGAVITAPYQNTAPGSGKWRRTRIFMPGLPDSAYNQGEPQAAYITAVDNLIADLQTAIVEGGKTYTYCAYRRASGTAYTVGTALRSLALGTQRRRYRPVI